MPSTSTDKKSQPGAMVKILPGLMADFSFSESLEHPSERAPLKLFRQHFLLLHLRLHQWHQEFPHEAIVLRVVAQTYVPVQ